MNFEPIVLDENLAHKVVCPDCQAPEGRDCHFYWHYSEPVVHESHAQRHQLARARFNVKLPEFVGSDATEFAFESKTSDGSWKKEAVLKNFELINESFLSLYLGSGVERRLVEYQKIGTILRTSNKDPE